MAAPLAVVIPCLEEADRLPLLLADLATAPRGLIAECLVVDGGSSDGSGNLAQLAGARLLHSPRGRGRQLQRGIAASTAPWLLLLHADARLQPGWAEAVQRPITAAATAAGAGGPGAWCFDLAVPGAALNLRLLEIAVAWRTRLRQLPYGDQGLLLPRQLLESCGGVQPLPLMEDLDLILRLRRITSIRSLGVALQVDGRRWHRHGVLGTAWGNAALRRAWRRGCSSELLAERYYGDAAGDATV
jgi:rSAM/selenodomain-associated transferase 2